MLSLLLTLTAHAAPLPELPPELADELARAQEQHRIGMYAGAIGTAGLMLSSFGLASGLTATLDDEPGGVALLTLASIGAAASMVTLDVGAPVALTGARRERAVLLKVGLSPDGGDGTRGWVAFGLQPFAVVTLPLAYASAGAVHRANQRAR